ncbi:outer dense fiber protein 3-B-like [Silurus meridionalis]|uniref:Outer dense fiber protein 3 n=1 Tax=Silurus meridionalis TaxID=175797 RepID=A0A8T0AYW6_SILME|nr:outer dense fiber protein 3-B-like [Silurus meridionalis]XP_046720777.1 outer dense fiber protein 3-B-like [Silurus meridionalis]XP_046720779.1 outer dense fiber protein 3-B-like [Silurus meridionalis]XP_046720780.1 outer dense fiber protein 3-B-like [Silurus meridionalis]KAF7698887.1 hypothetical protein HF521_003629 [Silurus meridionalis]KAI5098015.1 outer dense fiber protein 3-B [Silurus meridionalis]
MDNSGVWVGAWRPHRPKGPIAAMYKSPGPKYALPACIGSNDHDPRKWKAPAYSFGVRHQEPIETCSPGPCYLIPSNITKTGRNGSPAFSIYGRAKDPEAFKTPGPGTYEPEKAALKTLPSAPAFTMSPRTKIIRSDQTPGPAAYSLPPVVGPNAVNVKSGPSFSFGDRTKVGSFLEDLQKTPGPGTYKVVDTNIYKLKSPQFSMSGRNELPGDRSQNPGPGAHYPEQVTFTRPKAPSFTFGVRHSEHLAPLILEVVDD